MTRINTCLLPLTLAIAVILPLAACKPSTPAEPGSTAPAAASPSTETASTADTIALQSGTYTIDPTHTIVLAQWNHLGFSNPSANFGDATGEIVIDAEILANSRVDVRFPLASGIASFSQGFDEHLRNADFFEVDRFPEARFVSTSIESTGGNQYKVTGDLTIKDTTRPVVLEATLNGLGPHPMNQKQTIGFDATGSLKRSDFGLGMAAPAVSDEVNLRITTEAAVDAPAAEPTAEPVAE